MNLKKLALYSFGGTIALSFFAFFFQKRAFLTLPFDESSLTGCAEGPRSPSGALGPFLVIPPLYAAAVFQPLFPVGGQFQTDEVSLVVRADRALGGGLFARKDVAAIERSEEHTSELQSQR